MPRRISMLSGLTASEPLSTVRMDCGSMLTRCGRGRSIDRALAKCQVMCGNTAYVRHTKCSHEHQTSNGLANRQQHGPSKRPTGAQQATFA